ncbi:Whirlin [Folsomia candida]|uniref:Whirlin n=1 Tax=Folsomia candida TaxID=158441 RepID=A0A226E351_FOLCA|nr:Whirlin [Folsomia candida]
MSLSHTFSFKANPYVALQLGVPHPPKHSNFAPRPLQLHPPVLLTSRREEDETSCRSWWRVMSTSGAGGHHRTFARPSSSQGRFTSQQQPQPEQQPFHFSSLPITSNSNNNNRLQLHSQQQRRQHPGPAQGDNFVQTVELCKDEDTPSFGFNIKGGTEFGTAVHIWRVEENSLADRQGLRRGQQILQANGIDFTRISHSNALKVLKGRHYLKLLLDTRMNGGSSSSVVNKSASMVGDVSGYNFRPSSSQQTSSTAGMPVAWTWIDANGKIVPPPTPSSLINNKRMISLEINPGQSLGLLIRGGYEYGMGIYVTGVDHGSVAERGGLQARRHSQLEAFVALINSIVVCCACSGVMRFWT